MQACLTEQTALRSCYRCWQMPDIEFWGQADHIRLNWITSVRTIRRSSIHLRRSGYLRL